MGKLTSEATNVIERFSSQDLERLEEVMDSFETSEDLLNWLRVD